jgi:hypothetical protein
MPNQMDNSNNSESIPGKPVYNIQSINEWPNANNSKKIQSRVELARVSALINAFFD